MIFIYIKEIQSSFAKTNPNIFFLSIPKDIKEINY